MPRDDIIISPISIDLGAKNTGVYFAHYKADSPLEDIKKEGRVYQLEKDSYTLLMTKRTAARHQRRGIDRRQMVKRLFKLIWEKHFEMEWDKNVQQSVSFLLNRRGFSFLTEEYDAERLNRFPQEAYDKLPDELKQEFNDEENEGGYNFADKLIEWQNDGRDAISDRFCIINREPRRIRRRLMVISQAKKLKNHCETRITGNKIEEGNRESNKLSKLSKWILEKLRTEGIKGLDAVQGAGNNTVDMVSYLNLKEGPEVSRILDSIPTTYDEKEKKLRGSIWNFKAKFELEKADFDQPDELEKISGKKEHEKHEKDYGKWLNTHLHHLAFALQKTLNELESGGRHRSKYFKEIKDVLENKQHEHKYLMVFL